jgi:hypothetical protein
MIALVDTEALGETVLAAIVAGVAVTLVFSIAIMGAARFAEESRGGRPVAAAAFAVVAAAAGVLFVALIVFGLVVMTSK